MCILANGTLLTCKYEFDYGMKHPRLHAYFFMLAQGEWAWGDALGMVMKANAKSLLLQFYLDQTRSHSVQDPCLVAISTQWLHLQEAKHSRVGGDTR